MIKKTILFPLKRQFSIILTTFFICTAFLLIHNTCDYIDLQKELLSSSLQSYSSQMFKTTKLSYESYENICYGIAQDSAVQSYLKSKPSPWQHELYWQLLNTLSDASNLHSYIIDIAVYQTDGIYVSLSEASSFYEPFTKNLPKSRFPFQSIGTAMVNRVNCQILAMPVYTMDTSENNYLGIVFLAVNINALFDNSLGTDNLFRPHVVFTDANRELIYGGEFYYDYLNGLEEQGKILHDMEPPSFSSSKYTVVKYTVEVIDHSLYILMDKSQASRQVQSITLRLIILIGVLTVIILLLLHALHHPLLKSINKLTQFMKNIAGGDRRRIREGPAVHQGLFGSIEIDEMSKAFNEMLLTTEHLNRTIFDTYIRMHEMENNNRKTEIAFLRSQINPHFLYNTLTMICGMAAETQTDNIITVTGALSQIFRYSIKGSEMVTLRDEMEIVRSYLMIQEMRFENRFTVCYQFSEDSYNCLIPKMIIQPLVENAIIHGLEPV